jgi:hypothetical protein
MLRRSSGSGFEKPQSGFALCAVFSPPQFGQGSLLRKAHCLPKPSYTAGTLCAIVPKIGWKYETILRNASKVY